MTGVLQFFSNTVGSYLVYSHLFWQFGSVLSNQVKVSNFFKWQVVGRNYQVISGRQDLCRLSTICAYALPSAACLYLKQKQPINIHDFAVHNWIHNHTHPKALITNAVQCRTSIASEFSKCRCIAGWWSACSQCLKNNRLIHVLSPPNILFSPLHLTMQFGQTDV